MDKTDKVLHDEAFLKMIKTEKGFIYSERIGIDSIAVLPFYYSEEDHEWRVVVRMQPMTLDNSEHPKLYPCPITGSLKENYTKSSLLASIAEEIKEEADIDFEKVIEFYRTTETISTTQMNEVVHNFAVRIEPKSWASSGDGDGSVFEQMSTNISVPLYALRDTLTDGKTSLKRSLKEHSPQLGEHQIGEVALSSLVILVNYIYKKLL